MGVTFKTYLPRAYILVGKADNMKFVTCNDYCNSLSVWTGPGLVFQWVKACRGDGRMLLCGSGAQLQRVRVPGRLSSDPARIKTD